MKKPIIILAVLLSTVSLSAQYSLQPGQGQFNAGGGFTSRGLLGYFGFEFGVHKDISVGGTLSYIAYRERFLGTKYSHSIFGLSAFGNYHFNSLLQIPEQYDLYAGVNGGFHLATSPKNYPGKFKSGPGLGAHVGARMFFNDVFGINAEVSAGNFFRGGRFGITVKLPGK
jgi:outer membrane immunogenic protein